MQSPSHEGDVDGEALGLTLGDTDGLALGLTDGLALGEAEGANDGRLGDCEGESLGLALGLVLGLLLGLADGLALGETLGLADGQSITRQSAESDCEPRHWRTLPRSRYFVPGSQLFEQVPHAPHVCQQPGFAQPGSHPSVSEQAPPGVTPPGTAPWQAVLRPRVRVPLEHDPKQLDHAAHGL